MQSSKHWWIRMLKELTEYGKSIREEMKATLTEIKENPQVTNSEGKEAGVHQQFGTLGRNKQSIRTE